MAEPRPRNWKAMRADRVLAMAENRFGKRFASKEAAIAELVKLPAREQRSLKKVAVSKAERARRSAASDRMIAGMTARPKPREAIDAARAMSAQYLSAASKLADEHPGIASIKTRIARTAEAQAIGAEMKIASRVAKGQSTRAAKEAKPMAPIPERLKGLKRAQLAAVARDVGGISVNSKTTAAQLRAQINKRIAEQARYEAKNAVARQANAWGADPLAQRFDRGKVAAAAGKGRGAMESKINAAIDKVSATSPTKSAKTPAKSAKASKAARAPKANPAVVQELAAKYKAALAGNQASAMYALRDELAAAKLSKFDSHALAKAIGLPVAPSSSGAKARKSLVNRLFQDGLDLARASRLKNIAVAVGPAVMPLLAVAAAATAFSDSSHAGDGTVEASKQAAKAAGDVVSFGAISAHDKAKARGAGDVEAVASGAAVGAINFATFGVAEMANDALADKGGVSGVISDTVTKAAGKVGELFGWSDAAREAAAEARGAAKPGEAPSFTDKVVHEALRPNSLVATAAAAAASRSLPGAMLTYFGTKMVLDAVSPDKPLQPKAYLNEAAQRKAAEVQKAPMPAVITASGVQKSDGQTESYVRRGRSGQTVQVKGYRTPTR